VIDVNERSVSPRPIYRLRDRPVNPQNEPMFNASAERTITREPATTHAAQMRGQIMAGAQRAFVTTGYRGTSVPAIAAEAGVSVGLIYRYFSSKEELFLSVCQQSSEAQLNELATLLAKIQDPHARLRAAVDQFVSSLTDEGWGAIMVNAWAEADRNPRLRDLLVRVFEQHRGFSAMFIREAIARGEAPSDADVEALALAAALLLHGAIAHQAERGPRFDPEAVTRAITTVLGQQLRS
jgi:AcrR family transcriptional regulator